MSTVIVDEIHAVAGNKRGSHLALTLERLEHLAAPAGAADRPVRHPAADRARGPAAGRRGPGPAEPDGSPRCAIVDSGHRRELDLALELPDDELGAVASSEQMAEVLDLIAGHVAGAPHHAGVRQHPPDGRAGRPPARRAARRRARSPRTTAACPRTGGSGSRPGCAAGDLRALVATASLELGIDIGPVELVCQIGSPRSFATFLQRVGRSNHTRGGTPAGRLYPTTRDELVECAALLRGGAGRAGSTRCSVPDGAAGHPGPADGGRVRGRRTGPRTTCWPWSAGPPRSPG